MLPRLCVAAAVATAAVFALVVFLSSSMPSHLAGNVNHEEPRLPPNETISTTARADPAGSVTEPRLSPNETIPTTAPSLLAGSVTEPRLPPNGTIPTTAPSVNEARLPPNETNSTTARDEDGDISVDVFAVKRLWLHHTPKTGGQSLLLDWKKLPTVMDNCECCAPKVFQANETNISLFREPRAHVYSAMMHSKFANLQADARRKQAKPGSATRLLFPAEPVSFSTNTSITVRDFWTYLSFYDPDKGRWWDHPETNWLINPYNMQTRTMTCSYGSNHAVENQAALDLNVTAAKEMVLRMKWVGIIEQYRACFCMLRYQVFGKMPASCACDAQVQVATTHETHASPRHSLSDLPPDLLREIDRYTEHDRELYAFVRDLVMRRLAAVERITGTKIVCDEV